MKKRTALAAVALLALSVTSLTACGGSSDSAAPAASASMVGGDPGTWTPIMVAPDSIPDVPVDAKVGQAITFNFPLNDANGKPRVLVSSDPAVVEVTAQADEAGTMTFGAKAVAAGTAELTLSPEGAAAPDAAIIVNVTE